MKRAVIGIDGGLGGAVVGISQELQVLGWFDMPVIEDRKKTKIKSGKNIGKPGVSVKKRFDVQGLWTQLKELVEKIEAEGFSVMIYFEKAQAMPKQGLSSTFQTGRGFGLGEMALAALERPHQVVSASQWMKVAHKGVTGGETKARSFAQAARLFPSIPLKKPGGRVLSLDGRADASLIAYYGVTCITQIGEPPKRRKKASIKKAPVKKPMRKRIPFKREAFWDGQAT